MMLKIRKYVFVFCVMFSSMLHADETSNKMYMIEKFDKNGDHVVTQDEFLKSAEERFKTMDIDNDKTIEKNEFLKRYAERSHATTSDSATEVAQRVFEKLDDNKDGEISKLEYTQSRLKWFSEVDKDNNQRIETEVKQE